MEIEISKQNVGKLAERIVMNELEARGYRTTDLNKDGLSANADLLASKDGAVWQVQVKGSSNRGYKDWWVQLGYNTDEIIQSAAPMFNRKRSFYTADYVALVAVRSPKEYRCFILPIRVAERIAQLAMDLDHRLPKKDGGKKKPSKLWIWVGPRPNERRKDPRIEKMRRILQQYEADRAWDLKSVRARSERST